MLIERYSDRHIPEVRSFNQRLNSARSPFQFEANPSTEGGFSGKLNRIHSEHYVVLDDNGTVRGAYSLIFQDFYLSGSFERVAFLQIPISEGSINPAFSHIGLFLLKDAIRRSPLLFGLGMGGRDRPLPKLFKVFGALLEDVPFFFQVVRPNSFLRNASALQTKFHTRVAARVGSALSIGNLAFAVLNGIRSLHAVPRKDLHIKCSPDFEGIADEIWQKTFHQYSCISIRDNETLQYHYPLTDARFHRLAIFKGGQPSGWAVVTDSQMRGHNHFGNMRVGAIVDGLAMPGAEADVICAATYFLRDRNVDLIISNQLHPAWRAACVQAGFLKYPSNFIFAATPSLRNKIMVSDANLSQVHMNRGDGDGAYNL